MEATESSAVYICMYACTKLQGVTHHMFSSSKVEIRSKYMHPLAHLTFFSSSWLSSVLARCSQWNLQNLHWQRTSFQRLLSVSASHTAFITCCSVLNVIPWSTSMTKWMTTTSLLNTGNVLPIHYSAWTSCLSIYISVNHWSSNLKENTSDRAMT